MPLLSRRVGVRVPRPAREHHPSCAAPDLYRDGSFGTSLEELSARKAPSASNPSGHSPYNPGGGGMRTPECAPDGGVIHDILALQGIKVRAIVIELA